jgi:hypothetical protein
VSDAPAAPYPPSWVNRLLAWIDALRTPAWAVFLAVFVVVVFVSHAVAWVDGYVPVGSVDLFFSSGAFFLVLGYGGIYYLDRIAARAWARLRPVVALGEEEAARVAYELTTMPARPILVCAALGGISAVTFIALLYGNPLDLATGPISVVLGVPTAALVFTGTWALLYHSLQQLRIIGGLHRYIESIDVLHLERLHAFSSVTAWTAVALLVLGYGGVLAIPDSVANPQVLAWSALTTVAAVGCFFVPLYRVHGLIAAEKSRRLENVNGLLGRALDGLHRRVEQGDLSDTGAVNDQISSLLAEREVLIRVSTWPWSPGTLRGFSTAIVLPVALWLIYRVLEQLVA